MKISFNKFVIIMIAIAIVVIITIVGIIGKIRSNKNNGVNEGKLSTSDNSKNGESQKKSHNASTKYDGSVELGSNVEYTKSANSGRSSVIDGNTWYYDLDNSDNAINIYVNGELSGNVIIPSSIEGHKVISIGRTNSTVVENTLFESIKYRDEYWKKITSVVVSDGVQYINENAFYGMDNLEKISLPKSIIVIRNNAFESCKKLEEVNYNGKLTYIGRNVFEQAKYNNYFSDEQLP